MNNSKPPQTHAVPVFFHLPERNNIYWSSSFWFLPFQTLLNSVCLLSILNSLHCSPTNHGKERNAPNLGVTNHILDSNDFFRAPLLQPYCYLWATLRQENALFHSCRFRSFIKALQRSESSGLVPHQNSYQWSADVNEQRWRAVTWAQGGRNINMKSWPWSWKYLQRFHEDSRLRREQTSRISFHRASLFKLYIYFLKKKAYALVTRVKRVSNRKVRRTKSKSALHHVTPGIPVSPHFHTIPV